MKILTFDIEEWFHILDIQMGLDIDRWDTLEVRIYNNMENIFSLLESQQLKATFFCLGWIAEKHPNVIKDIDKAGYEIGSHSHFHQLAYTQNKRAFEEDLKRSICEISNITGKQVNYYRAPGFSITKRNKWAFEILYKYGITVDSSVFPAVRGHGGIADFPSNQPCLIDLGDGILMKEFPINTRKFFSQPFVYSGGGYFRFFSPLLLNYYFKMDKYVMTYFHPRDFDFDQPRLNELSWFRFFKSYYGLSRSFNKLARLSKRIELIDMKTAIESINWSEVPVVKIKDL